MCTLHLISSRIDVLSPVGYLSVNLILTGSSSTVARETTSEEISKIRTIDLIQTLQWALESATPTSGHSLIFLFGKRSLKILKKFLVSGNTSYSPSFAIDKYLMPSAVG